MVVAHRFKLIDRWIARCQKEASKRRVLRLWYTNASCLTVNRNRPAVQGKTMHLSPYFLVHFSGLLVGLLHSLPLLPNPDWRSPGPSRGHEIFKGFIPITTPPKARISTFIRTLQSPFSDSSVQDKFRNQLFITIIIYFWLAASIITLVTATISTGWGDNYLSDLPCCKEQPYSCSLLRFREREGERERHRESHVNCYILTLWLGFNSIGQSAVALFLVSPFDCFSSYLSF